MVTLWPARRSEMAAVRQAIPAPTITILSGIQFRYAVRGVIPRCGDAKQAKGGVEEYVDEGRNSGVVSWGRVHDNIHKESQFIPRYARNPMTWDAFPFEALKQKCAPAF